VIPCLGQPGGLGKSVGKSGWKGAVSKRRERSMSRKTSLCERPIGQRPRRLADWLNPTGAGKVHSLVDKVYKPKNLELAWEKVRRTQGRGGVDGESLASFEEKLEANLKRLHEELRADRYRPQPVRQQLIPKPGQPEKLRPLGIPTIYDRACQQALLNRLEPIFDPVFDEANFGYRKGRSPKDALGKVMSFRWMETKPDGSRGWPLTTAAGGNKSCSRFSSPVSGESGQLSPETVKRRRYSATVLLAMRQLLAICRLVR